MKNKYGLTITSLDPIWIRDYYHILKLKEYLKVIYNATKPGGRLIISFNKFQNTEHLENIYELYAFVRTAGWNLWGEYIVHRKGKGGGLFGTHNATKPHITYRHKKILIFFKETKSIYSDEYSDITKSEYAKMTRSSVVEMLHPDLNDDGGIVADLLKLYSHPGENVCLWECDNYLTNLVHYNQGSRKITTLQFAGDNNVN